MSGSSNVEVVQRQSVLARHAGGMGSESGLVEHLIQDLARTVAGEHPAGPVGTMRARSESQNQDARGRIAERRYGKSPIGLVAVCAPFELRDFCRMPPQTGAAFTGDDFTVEYFQQSWPEC